MQQLNYQMMTKGLFAFTLMAVTAWLGVGGLVSAHREEPTNGAPTTKAECKNGGWEDFGFSNQGHCVSYVARTQNHGYSNRNNVTITNTNNQSASTGDATVSGNTSGGNATSGNASNSNQTTNTVNISN